MYGDVTQALLLEKKIFKITFLITVFLKSSAHLASNSLPLTRLKFFVNNYGACRDEVGFKFVMEVLKPSGCGKILLGVTTECSDCSSSLKTPCGDEMIRIGPVFCIVEKKKVVFC